MSVPTLHGWAAAQWPCPEQIPLSESVFNLPCAKHVPSKQVASAAIVANLLNEQMANEFCICHDCKCRLFNLPHSRSETL